MDLRDRGLFLHQCKTLTIALTQTATNTLTHTNSHNTIHTYRLAFTHSHKLTLSLTETTNQTPIYLFIRFLVWKLKRNRFSSPFFEKKCEFEKKKTSIRWEEKKSGDFSLNMHTLTTEGESGFFDPSKRQKYLLIYLHFLPIITLEMLFSLNSHSNSGGRNVHISWFLNYLTKLRFRVNFTYISSDQTKI